MNAKSSRNWNAGLKIDGIANAVVLGAGLVVVLFAATPAGRESAMPEQNAYQEQAGALPDTMAPA